MNVRAGILAVLSLGPCYGYQARAELARRTGTAPVNVGQIYNTIDRLVRDKLAVPAEPDDAGRERWVLTPAGEAELRAWFATPAPLGASLADELAPKLALAASLPSIDVAAVLASERRAEAEATADATALAGRLRASASSESLAARTRWLDEAERMLADAQSFPLDAEPPRRGRPPGHLASA